MFLHCMAMSHYPSYMLYIIILVKYLKAKQSKSCSDKMAAVSLLWCKKNLRFLNTYIFILGS